jgi:hypothetical protein
VAAIVHESSSEVEPRISCLEIEANPCLDYLPNALKLKYCGFGLGSRNCEIIFYTNYVTTPMHNDVEYVRYEI